jgi:hypothetical protein
MAKIEKALESTLRKARRNANMRWFVYDNVYDLATESHILNKTLVDVAGIEPATPCLQMKFENAMWLLFLAFTYVAVHGF